MSQHHGQFVWYELLTTDPQAALAFYGDVLGWGGQDSGTPGMNYTLLSVGDAAPFAGLMALPPEARAAGAPPAWTGYIAVDDVDAGVASVLQAGGSLHRPAADIPNVGRFALVGDPQGAIIVLFKGASDQPPAKPAAGTPGYVGWHEHYANDATAAFDFYASQFGWTRTDAVDMGPAGVYQLFATEGSTSVGGMMKRPPEVPVCCWLYYFNVADIKAALARVQALAGKVLMGPVQVPGGSWIAQCVDPQGAVFAIVQPQAEPQP